MKPTLSSPTQSGLPRLALTLALLTTTLVGCSESRSDLEGLPRHNLIVVLVDTLRADHLGFYGYERDTSPFLDSVAKEGVVFERAYSTSSFTRESVSALFTGRLPSLSGSMGWNAAPSDQLVGLGQLFLNAGYRTGFFTTTLMLDDERYAQGFEEVGRLAKKAGLSRESQRLTNRALKFIEKHGDESFMLYLHYLDPHGPYHPPTELHSRIAETIHEKPIGLYKDLRREVPKYVSDGFGPGEARFEDMVARYDAEIVDLDNAIRSLFEGLERSGQIDKTMVVLTADHGEEFLEHGFIEHAWTLYNESIHVPLVFWAPGHLEPQRVTQPVSHLDVLPTIAKLMQLPLNARLSDGEPLFSDDLQPIDKLRPVVSELLIKHRCVIRSAQVGDWKYVQARRWLSPAERSDISTREGQLEKASRDQEFDYWGEVVLEELFNLADDPLETTNLVDAEPDQLANMRAIMSQHERNARLANPDQHGQPQELDEEEQQRLKDLGYL